MAGTSDLDALAQQLNTAQRSSSGLHLATLELKRLLAAQPELYSCEGGLTSKLQQLLLAPTRKDVAVERLHKLFAQVLVPGIVASGDDDDDDGEDATDDAHATLCLLDLLKCCGAANKNVRLHACRLAAATLDAVAENEDAEISSVPWDALRLAMLPRLRDKIPAVRAASAAAFRHIQNTDEPEDEATVELLRLAQGDSAKDVRTSATKSFNLTHATLPVLLSNTRDSAFEVRTAAIERLGREVAAETLAVPQRAALVTRALSDRHPAVVAQGRWLVVQCWLKRCSWDPLEVLNLMDCDGLESMEYASHESANTPAALVAHTILDVADDFDAPAKGLADYSFTNSPDDRDTLDQHLEQHASKVRADAKLAREHEDEDEYIRAPPTAASLLLLRLRAERIHRNASGRGSDAVARDAALEALLPEPAAFADLLAGSLRAATRAAANADAEANALEDAEATAEASGKAPYKGSLLKTAKAAEDEATMKLSAALQALKLVSVLDRQEESGRAALVAGMGGAALSDLMPDEIVEATVAALAAVNGGNGRSYAVTCLKLMSECAANAADPGNASVNASTASNPGEATADIEGQAELSNFWNRRLVVIAAEALKFLTPTALAAVTPTKLAHDDDEEEEEEEEEEEDSDDVGSDEAANASLVAAFEGPLAMLLATGTDPEMREQVMVGLGRLSLLDEKTALKYLPALVNASVTTLEQLPVRAAAFQAVVDLALLFDGVATALRDPKHFKSLPGVAAFCEENTSMMPADCNFLVGMIKALLQCAGDGESRHLSSMVSLVAEGAAKLVIAKRLVATADDSSSTHDEEVATVLDALLVTYFNPPERCDDDDDDDDHSASAEEKDAMSKMEAEKALGSMGRMQQVLSVFFPAFATAVSSSAPSQTSPEGHGVGVRCLRGALRSLLGRYCVAAANAGNGSGDEDEDAWSPLGAVPVSRVLLFILSLLDLADTGKSPGAAAPSGDNGGQEDENAKVEEAAASFSRSGSHATAAMDICYALLSIQPTTASNGNGVSVARKSLAKALGALPAPEASADSDLLKLVTELADRAGAAVGRSEGMAVAKPIRKFAEACKLADPSSETSLPSERRAVSREEYLRFAAAGAGISDGSEELALLTAALKLLDDSDDEGEGGEEDAPTSRRTTKGSRRARGQARTSMKEASSEEGEGDNDEEEVEEEEAEEEVEGKEKEEQTSENTNAAEEAVAAKSKSEPAKSRSSNRASRSRAALAESN